MGKTLRRMTILALTMTIFALVMNIIVEQPQRRVHRGTNIPCLHPQSLFCVATS